MSKLDNLINKFFDRLRRGIVNSYGKEILKNPEVRKAAEGLRKAEEDLLKTIGQEFEKSK
tara:strand:+ start:312 stop:491 length:180 start_codon:yes stop_codon:yes gene_type:complete